MRAAEKLFVLPCAPVSPYVRWGSENIFAGGGQLRFLESSMHLEQEWVFNDLRGSSLCVCKPCWQHPHSSSKHLGLLRRKTYLKRHQLFWCESTLASKVFSSARKLLHSWEGGGVGRKYFWWMELSFCPLESESMSLDTWNCLFCIFPMKALIGAPYLALKQHTQFTSEAPVFSVFVVLQTLSFGRKVYLSPNRSLLPPQIWRQRQSFKIFRLLGSAGRGQSWQPTRWNKYCLSHS